MSDMNAMNEGLEYLFFTRQMADTFGEYLRVKGLVYTETIEPMQGAMVLTIAEGVEDELWDELDDYHDALSEADQALLAAEDTDADGEHSAAGIYLQLLDGRQTIAQVDPDIMSRILGVLSMDELNNFVDTIVRSVEIPDDSAICKR